MNGSFKVGDRVRYINARIRTSTCPPVGTVGEVLAVAKFGVMVQWPKGSTTGDGRWWHIFGSVEAAEDGREAKV